MFLPQVNDFFTAKSVSLCFGKLAIRAIAGAAATFSVIPASDSFDPADPPSQSIARAAGGRRSGPVSVFVVGLWGTRWKTRPERFCGAMGCKAYHSARTELFQFAYIEPV
jgi:hypothetical protein